MKEGQGNFFVYFKTDVHLARHNFGKDRFKVAMTVETPLLIWREYKELASIECAGQGYPTGGLSVPNIEIDTDKKNGSCLIRAGDVLFKKINVGAPACAVVYNESNGLLVSYYTMTTVTNGGDYKILIPKGELFYFE